MGVALRSGQCVAKWTMRCGVDNIIEAAKIPKIIKMGSIPYKKVFSFVFKYKSTTCIVLRALRDEPHQTSPLRSGPLRSGHFYTK